MSEIGSINTGTVHTVGEQSTSELEHTGSVQFMYAMLQMELAQSNKDAALNKIDGIKEAQTQSKAYTEQMNELRNMQMQMDSLQSQLDALGGNYLMDDLFSKEDLDAEITRMNNAITEINAKIAEAPDDNSSTVQVSKELQDYVNGMDSELMVDMQRGGKDQWHYDYELQAGLKVFEARLEVLEQASALYDDMAALCDKAGITVDEGGTITSKTLDSAISNLEGLQESVSADIQQEMVYVQDYMGQYNAYTQGSSSAVSEANETLKTLARG